MFVVHASSNVVLVNGIYTLMLQLSCQQFIVLCTYVDDSDYTLLRTRDAASCVVTVPIDKFHV